MSIQEAYRRGLATLGSTLNDMNYRGKAFLLSPSPTHYSYPPQASRQRRSCEVTEPWNVKQVTPATTSIHVVDQLVQY